MKKKKTTLRITIPTKWSELTPAQVSRVARYLDSHGDPTEQLVLLAADFADLKLRDTIVAADGTPIYRFYHRKDGNVNLDAEQITLIISALKWITGDVSLMQSPVLDGCVTPDHRLYGVTLEQFITAEVAYSHFLSTRNIEALRMCAAALYPRHSFSAEKLPAESQRMARLDVQLSAVYLWFTGIKKYLAEKYSYIFSDGGDGTQVGGSEIMLSMLSSLNGGDVTKNETLKATELHEVLYELNEKIKTSKRNV